MSSTAPSPQPTPQALIDAAKQSIVAYNDKNWDNVRAVLTQEAVYDEVATQRRLQGPDQVIECWQSWAQAFPDSKATFHSAIASGTTVCVEVSWRGTHLGQLDLPTESVPATERAIDLRACQVFEMSGNKVGTMRHYFDMATLLQQLGLVG